MCLPIESGPEAGQPASGFLRDLSSQWFPFFEPEIALALHDKTG
jgi:hypothetical protein